MGIAEPSFKPDGLPAVPLNQAPAGTEAIHANQPATKPAKAANRPTMV